EESHVKETNSDLDYPATNRKKRDSRLDDSSPSQCKQYPRLLEALALYMMACPEDEKVYPGARHVVDVMNAAEGATEEEVLGCLSYLRNERGLKAGTRTGPRHFSWFPTMVADYFLRKRDRPQLANPVGVPDTDFTKAQLDSMTDAI